MHFPPSAHLRAGAQNGRRPKRDTHQHLLKDDAQVYRQFIENWSFIRFAGDMLYAMTNRKRAHIQSNEQKNPDYSLAWYSFGNFRHSNTRISLGKCEIWWSLTF